MVQLFDREYTREEFQQYFGSMEQVGGIRRYQYTEGRAKNLEAVELRTGSGLRFEVLPDRGMDLGLCEYRGIPLTFRSAVGEATPYFYEPEGDEWLRNYLGGMLTTCGLTYLGAPCEDKGEKLGLHGRISNIPASDISMDKEWQGHDCLLKVSGKVREAKMLSTNLVLEREISAELGGNTIYIDDTVKNEGFETTPLMILYHINVGHPLLDKGARFVAESQQVEARDEVAEPYLDDYDIYRGPTRGYPDTVFYHKLSADQDGYCHVSLHNKELGLAFIVKYEKKNLPEFIQWKYTNQGNYVAGLEPANSRVGGRDRERQRGALEHLEPGATREYHLELTTENL